MEREREGGVVVGAGGSSLKERERHTRQIVSI